MERSVWNFGILCLILMVAVPVFAGQDGVIRKVVIDPGHGGKDPGASGRSSQEKAIVLKVAQKLGEMITSAYPEIEVIYTRKNDQFIELHKRTEIANRNHADLFISIHCNANKNRQINGAETFVMGLHKSEQNLEVAKLENASILQEDSYESSYQGFNPNSDEDHIALSMFQSAFLDQSLDFSGIVQEHLQNTSSRANRGVKQAGFLVLARATMPAVLVELGFISNPNEELFLVSDKGQQQLARSIFNAFSTYKSGQEKLAEVSQQKDSSANGATIKQENIVKKDTKPAEIKNEVVFKVQVHATRNRNSFNRNEVEKQYKVTEFQHNGFTKYAVGDEVSLAAANVLLEKVKKSGFPDAFVIAFVNGELTPPVEASKLSAR